MSLFNRVRSLSRDDIRIRENEYPLPRNLAYAVDVSRPYKTSGTDRLGHHTWSEQGLDNFNPNGFGLYFCRYNVDTFTRSPAAISRIRQAGLKHCDMMLTNLMDNLGFDKDEATRILSALIVPGNILFSEDAAPFVIFHERMHQAINEDTTVAECETLAKARTLFLRRMAGYQVTCEDPEVMERCHELRGRSWTELYATMAHQEVFAIGREEPAYLGPEICAAFANQFPDEYLLYSQFRDFVALEMMS